MPAPDAVPAANAIPTDTTTTTTTTMPHPYASKYRYVTPEGLPTIWSRYVQGAPMKSYFPYLHDILFLRKIPYYQLEVYNRITFPDRVHKLFADPRRRARWATAALINGAQTCVTNPKAVAWCDEVAVSLIYHQDEKIVTSHLARLAQFLDAMPCSFMEHSLIYTALVCLDI